jgi:tight adherence protein C
MLILYSIILSAVFIFYIISFRYKKSIIKDLNRKEHPLKFIYGMIMFAADKVSKKLYLKNKMNEKSYFLNIKKLSFSVCIFLLFIAIGFVKGTTEKVAGSNVLKELNRPGYGEGSKEYDLNARIKGSDEIFPIHIEIGEIELTNEEKMKMIEDSYSQLLSTFLGENQTQDEITKDMNFVSEINHVKVFWEIPNTELIDYNGKIHREKVQGQGELIYLTAILSFEDVEKSYEMPVVIMSANDNKGLSAQEKIQQSIDENNSRQSTKIVLPAKIDDDEIKFFNDLESGNGLFFIIAVIGGVIIFIAQNKESKNKLKRRNEQMMNDYAEIVSKLTLLSDAGLSIKSSFNRIAQDYERNKMNKERYAYEEIRLTYIMMKNGTSEAQAYEEFGQRCNLQCYLRLGGFLSQNITKGTKGLKTLLEQEVMQAFEDRKNLAKARGEEASTKLLLPMIMMLVIVIVIIIVPAFSSMNL